MQRIIIIILLSLSGCVYSQNFRFYKAGQKFASSENACLVIKNEKKCLANLDQLQNYSSFKAVKLIGFTDLEFDIDSLLSTIAYFIKPQVLIIENCDLSGLMKPLNALTELEELRILSNSNFYENSLFEALKDSPLKKLSIQKHDEDLVTDSLYLLSNLTTLFVSSSNIFTSSNKTEKIQIASINGTHSIDVVFCGNFYKTEKNNRVAINKIPQEKSSVIITPFRSVNQPIPGIDINDTSYSFSALSGKKMMYESGSEISIDKNAFVTSAGAPYTGNVKLFYRELRNPVEIMLSGLPMSTKVDGKTELFKSGGMYEINAYDTKGDPLKARSDTSIKINFALTDTSENFKFYSLEDNGNWATKASSVKSKISKAKDSASIATRAVKEYYGFMSSQGPRSISDTTNYEARFLDKNYLYTYRKDNLSIRKDSVKYFTSNSGFVTRNKGRNKALFRIKYVKQTKEKDIIFTIVQANKNYYGTPRHIQQLLGKTYLYTGSLTKEEFVQTYNRKLLCWDVRPNSFGNGIDLTIKTDRSFINITGKLISLLDDGTFYVPKKAGIVLNKSLQRNVQLEAKLFNRKNRPSIKKYNDVNALNIRNPQGLGKDELAYNHCKKYQIKEEKQMDFKAWKQYVKKNFPNYYYNSFQNENEVGSALVKSGLGVKNIDAYIHSGEMEEIFVNYENIPVDSLMDQYNAVLFKSINTSYPISKSYQGNTNSLAGYYFKKHENYIVRFSGNGFMQVTKPSSLANNKKGNQISIAYQQQYNVAGKTSKEITSLILD